MGVSIRASKPENQSLVEKVNPIFPYRKFKFYLHDIGADWRCSYGNEIYEILKNHPWRTRSYKDAAFVFMLFSNELNYHPTPFDSSKAILQIDQACKRTQEFIDKQQIPENLVVPHIVFEAVLYTPMQTDPNCRHVFNIGYAFVTSILKPDHNKRTGWKEAAAQFNPQHVIIAPPPARTIFEAKFDRTTFVRGSDKYRAAFKGVFGRGYARKTVARKIAPVLKRSPDIIYEERDSRNHDYKDLMTHSSFLFQVDGDLPWAYRFTEILASGAMPVIVDTDNWILPFSQLIDWDEAVIRVPMEKMDEIDLILDSYDDKKMLKKYAYLKEIVTKYTKSRKEQVETMLLLLEQMRLPGYEHFCISSPLFLEPYPFLEKLETIPKRVLLVKDLVIDQRASAINEFLSNSFSGWEVERLTSDELVSLARTEMNSRKIHWANFTEISMRSIGVLFYVLQHGGAYVDVESIPSVDDINQILDAEHKMMLVIDNTSNFVPQLFASAKGNPVMERIIATVHNGVYDDDNHMQKHFHQMLIQDLCCSVETSMIPQCEATLKKTNFITILKLDDLVL